MRTYLLKISFTLNFPTGFFLCYLRKFWKSDNDFMKIIVKILNSACRNLLKKGYTACKLQDQKRTLSIVWLSLHLKLLQIPQILLNFLHRNSIPTPHQVNVKIRVSGKVHLKPTEIGSRTRLYIADCNDSKKNIARQLRASSSFSQFQAFSGILPTMPTIPLRLYNFPYLCRDSITTFP